MRVYLVYPDIASIHGLPYHPGLASIASFLRAKGHEVKVAYFSDRGREEALASEIAAFGPDIVGFTAVETQFGHVKSLAARIRKACPCPIVCGGPYVTLAPEVVLESGSPLDAVVIGEGEHAAAEVLDKIASDEEWRGAKNLAYKDSRTGRLVTNPLNQLIAELDRLPYPAIDLFPYQEIIDRENIAMFHFNRGCPYRCHFCSNVALGRVYGMGANRLRYRSVGSVIDEIRGVLSRYMLRDDTLLYFGDDLFIFDKAWITDFCLRYRREIDRPFWCTGRSNLLSEEICKALKGAGCTMLMMSVESGNDYIRNEVMGRGISRETMFRSFELCHRYGINTLASCIIGLPSETPEMIEDSIRTVAQLKSISSYGINIFYPYSGTHLRKVCEEKGLMPEGTGKGFVERRQTMLNLPDLSAEKLDYYYANWVRLIMKHKGVAEQAKYAVRCYWDGFRATAAGQHLKRLAMDTAAGRRFKKVVMKLVWNKV